MKPSKKHSPISRGGFTLIELLVVVAIIGILATIILTSLSKARSKARDARRQSDIHTIQTQLEMYYIDHGEYPIRGWTSSNNVSDWTAFGAQLGLDLPVDPANDPATGHAYVVGNYVYSYFGTAYGCPGQWYMLLSQREGNPAPKSPGIKSCTSNFNYSGTVTVGMNNRS